MPLLTRLYARAALVNLVVALSVAALMAVRGVLGLPESVATLRPVYFHFFSVGWVIQLIFGVMHWMFPTASQEKPRGNEGLVWAAYFLLNGGLLRVVAEPVVTLGGGAPWGALLALSAVLQWLAGVAFVINTWPRVKER